MPESNSAVPDSRTSRERWVRVAKNTLSFATAASILICGSFMMVVAGSWVDLNFIRPAIGYYPLLALVVRILPVLVFLGFVGAIAIEW